MWLFPPSVPEMPDFLKCVLQTFKSSSGKFKYSQILGRQIQTTSFPSFFTADPVHPAEGAEAVQAHRGSQVHRLGQEEDGRVREEVHVQVWRQLQEVSTSARTVIREGMPCFGERCVFVNLSNEVFLTQLIDRAIFRPTHESTQFFPHILLFRTPGKP